MKIILKLAIYVLALIGISSLFSKVSKQYNLKEPMAYKIIFNKFTSDYSALKMIDKIYFINLDRSKDRLESVTKELENLNLGVEYSRFAAVSGKDVSVVNLDNNQTFIVGDKINTKVTLLGNYEVKCSDLDSRRLFFFSYFNNY